MKLNSTRVTDGILVFSALVMTSLFAHRELTPDRTVDPTYGPAEHVEHWTDIAEAGVWMGSRAAPVTIVEFADLECPACRQFSRELREIQKQYGTRVSVVFVHYPLPQHRFATISARALECADEQKTAQRMMEALYAGQDSLGLRSWAAYGREAQIPSIADFVTCVSNQRPFPRIAEGHKWGTRIELRGTPTILVNGWRVPSARDVRPAIDSLLVGRKPFTTYETRKPRNDGS